MKIKLSILSVLFMVSAHGFAADYKVPTGDAQYSACLGNPQGWQGGNEKAPNGQTKLEAFCTCVWNETPDDFKGDLAKFSDSPQGKSVNKTCETYSNWGG